MADSASLPSSPSSPSSSANESGYNHDSTNSSEELEQKISAESPPENSDAVDTVPDGRNSDYDQIQPSQEFKYSLLLTWLELQDLVPGTGKIGENYDKDEKQSLQDSGKYDEKRQLQDSGEKDAISLPRKVRKLEANHGKKYNKDEKRPLLDSGKYEEIFPRKVRKSNGNNNVDPRTESYLSRLRSDEETQIMLLIGMIEYHRRNGVYPFENAASLQDFINVVLLERYTHREGLQEQVERLWMWYDVRARNFEPKNEGERELFELAERIWGGESVQDPAPNFYPVGTPEIMNNDYEAGPSNAIINNLQENLQEYQIVDPEIMNDDYEAGPENFVNNDELEQNRENQVENPEIMNNDYETGPLNVVHDEVEVNQESFQCHVGHLTEEGRESMDLAGIIWDSEPEDVAPLNSCPVEDPWFMNANDCEAGAWNDVNNELEEKQEECFRVKQENLSSQEKKDGDEEDVCKAGSPEAARKEDATETEKQESFQGHDAAGESSPQQKNDATESTGK